MLSSKSIKQLIGAAIDSNEVSFPARKILSLVAMLAAVVLSFPTYTGDIEKSFFWVWTRTETASVSLAPTVTSTICAIFLVFPVILRNSIKASPYNIIQNILNILFTASSISIFVSSKPWSIPIININSSSLLIFVIITSWIGMKSISGFAWLFIIIASIFRLGDVDAALGFFGSLIIITGMISIFLQIRDMDNNILGSIKSDFWGYKESVQNDLSAAKSTIDSAVKM